MYDIAEAKIIAEHKGGRLLAEIERQQGGDRRSEEFQTRQSDGLYSQIAEIGLTEATARRWQIMALVLDDDLQAYFAGQQCKHDAGVVFG